MALFEPNARISDKYPRSNTKLVVSGGDSPAEKWIVDPDLEVLFTYEYGGPGQKDVVIAKGMAVAIHPTKKVVDPDTGAKVNVVTIPDGTPNLPVIGVAPYNFTKFDPVRLTGNQPAIITREYIELPLFPTAASCENVLWGAVYGDLKPGDYVAAAPLTLGATNLPTNNYGLHNGGKLTKYDPATMSPTQVVGQVLAIEDDQEPHGWLKWAMWDETAMEQDSGYTGGPVPQVGQGWPYDPEYRNFKNNYGYLTPYTTQPTGIPGLTDGAEKAKTILSKTVVGFVPAGTTAGTKLTVDLGYKNIIKGSFANVTIGGNPVTEGVDFTVDYDRGILSYVVPADVTAAQDLVIGQFRAYFFGTPTGWDFTNAIGAARILLKL